MGLFSRAALQSTPTPFVGHTQTEMKMSAASLLVPLREVETTIFIVTGAGCMLPSTYQQTQGLAVGSDILLSHYLEFLVWPRYSINQKWP